MNNSQFFRRRGLLGGRTLRTILVIGTLSALALSPARHAGAVAAQPDLSTVIDTVTTGTLTKVAEINPTTLPAQASGSPRGTQVMPVHYPYASPQQHLAQAAAAATAASAPQVPGSEVSSEVGQFNILTPTKVISNFIGLTTIDSADVNGGIGNEVEPPDQGLCVGPGASGTGAVLEAVNDVLKIYSPTGTTLLGRTSLASFFGDSVDSLSDPRCFYDATTHTWFITLIAYQIDILGNILGSHVDLAVNPTVNPLTTWHIYQISTTDLTHTGCPCLGDQPLLGVDAHGVFISTNEFGNGSAFNGAQLYAIDKAQLVAGASSVFTVHYSGLHNGGTLAASLEPASTPGASPAEYFVDSLDPNGTTDNRIGVWALTNDFVLDTGGIPKLSGIVITSQTYGLPPSAVQRGTSNLLNADDDRMLQVQNVGGTLWSSLTTVAHVTGDTTNRAGAAWFTTVPTLTTALTPTISSATITAQGIVAISRTYLLYPAIAVNDIGDAAMIMSESGSALFPSAVYATGPHFATLQRAATGATFDHGFTCSPCRWGDYSAAVWSSIAVGARQPTLWLATAYISPVGDVNSNWSTRLTEVIPQGG